MTNAPSIPFTTEPTLEDIFSIVKQILLKLEEHDKRFDKTEECLDQHNKRFDKVENELIRTNNRLDNLFSGQIEIKSEIINIEKSFANFRSDIMNYIDSAYLRYKDSQEAEVMATARCDRLEQHLQIHDKDISNIKDYLDLD